MNRRKYVLVIFAVFFGISIVTSTSNETFIAMQTQFSETDSYVTSSIGDDFEDFIDQISDLHAPTDIGTHSVFSDLQDYGINYDQMTESNTGSSGFNLEDYVDQQSNLHDPTDIGTHSNFAEMQDIDAIYDMLTEANTATAAINEYRAVDGVSSAEITWTTVGTSPYLDAQDQPTNYIHSSSNAVVSTWYTFADTSGISGTFTVNCSIYWMCSTSGGDSYPQWEIDWTGDGVADASGSTATRSTWAWVDLGTISGLDTVTEINAARIRFTLNKGSGGPDQVNIDAVRLGISQPSTPNYDLDLEVGWTAADYDETNEYLCIYGGSQGTEGLRIDVWDGSQWQNVISDLTTGWNNVSVSSYLTSSSFEIRFTDTSDDSTVEDAWEIEGVMLHVWTGGFTNYELDLEVGWTAADYDEVNEELCIYPITGGGWPSEDIKVDVWNGVWTNVIVDLTPDQWNNVSISSYLTSSAFEIRFLGGTETGDTSQDTWAIDTVILHTWTVSYSPVNDQSPTLDNPTDTDNMYAQYQEYQITAYVSDQNGFADISYLEIGFWDNAQTTEYCRFRYNEDTNTFTEEYDGGTYVSLNTGSSSATESGNDIDATFYFTIDWDFPDSTDIDARCYVVDTQTESSTTWYEVNWDVETRLDYSTVPSITDSYGTADRGDLDGSFSMTGTIIYYNSIDDVPSSAAIDVWVSASEYGTNFGPWSDLTPITGTFNVTCYADDEIGLDTYTIKIVEEDAGADGNDLYHTTSVTDSYVADRVQVQSYSVTDSRVNLDASVNIDVTLHYDYDDTPVTDGSVTINDVSATHQGSGIWRISDSESTVTMYTYDTIAYSGGEHGLSIVDQNGQSQAIIWDQVIVVSYSVSDNRVNLDTSVNIDVTLHYDYDDTPVTDGSVTINTISATHQGSGVWRISPSQSSVIGITYNLVAVSANFYDIVSVNQNSQSQLVIWDQIVVIGYTISDPRVNIDDTVNIDVTLEYAYDNNPVTDGTVTINTISATHQGSGVWRIIQSQGGVQSVTYNTVATSENAYDITSVNQNSQSTTIIWDQIVVQTTTVDDSRIGTGDFAEIRVTLQLAYDSTPLGSGDAVTLDGIAMTWDGVNSWFSLSRTQASVGQWIYFVNSSTDTTYGITALDIDSITVSVIWDRVQVQSYSVIDNRIDIDTSATIDVTLFYDYDDTAVIDGVVTVNGLSATHQGLGVWRFTDSKSSVQLVTYDTVSVSGNTNGISAVDQNSLSTDVIWDRVQVQSYSVINSRVNIDDAVSIDVTLCYDYDNSPVTDGIVTINGLSATHQGLGIWRVTDSESNVMANTYNVVAASENTYNITVVDQNSQSQQVIWDQITVRSYSASDSHANIDESINIEVTLEYEYDDTPVTDGTVTINTISATHQGSGVWRISDSESVVTMNTYNSISCSGNTNGISSVNQNSQSINVIWDRIQVQSYSVSNARVNVDDVVNIDVTLYYDYNDSPVIDGTVTINGISADHQGSGIWRISDIESTIIANTYNMVASSGNTYDITVVDQNSQSQQVIWDQITVRSYSVSDSRVNVDDVVNIDVTLEYEYDDTPVIDGTVTINGTIAAYQGSGVWRISDSESVVTMNTYNSISCSGNTNGISSVNQNSQSINVIWDRVQVQTYVTDDSRVDINTIVQVNITLYYDYDNTPVIDGSVTVNGVSATHQSTGIWSFSVSQSSVQLVTYETVVCSSNTYEITSVDTNLQSQDVIWDRVQVQSYSATDSRVNVDDSVNVDVTLYYDYDNAPVIDGTVTINGETALHQGSGIWRISVSESIVTANTYNLVACSGNNLGITAVDQNSLSQQIIWDQIQVQSYLVSDSHASLNENVNIDVSLVYDYDNNPVTDGTITINGILAAHQGSGIWRIIDSESTVIANTYNSIIAFGNEHNLSLVDQNSQSTTVIWDQIVVTIGVDDSMPLNSMQANFTLSVIFDYNDAACTTYQIVIQRNGTWWHSFTDTNKSLFVDTNSDVSYTYTVQIVTSESTYNILAFSTNSRQVIWSAAPNNAPTNDNAPTLTNPDDTSYLYARYKCYIITSNASDLDGWNTIQYIELSLYNDTPSAPIWTIRYTVATDSFSIEVGSGFIIISSSSYATGSDTNLDVIWYIKIDWDHVDLLNTDTRQYVYDGLAEDEDFYETNWSVETRLEVTGFSVDDGLGTEDRGPLDGSFFVTGTIIYFGSGDNYPLSNETDVWLSSSEYGAIGGPWSDLDLVSGFFNITAFADDVVGLDTLTVIVVEELAGSGGTDLLAATTQSSYIADRVKVQAYTASDPRVNIGDTVTIDVELTYEYDLSVVIDGFVAINGISASYVGGGIWRIFDSKITVQSVTYDTTSYSGGSHGLYEVNPNAMSQEVIWDEIIIQTTFADDTRVDASTGAEVRVNLILAYDSSSLGSGDTVTLNGQVMAWDSVNSWFELTVSQDFVGQWLYYVNSTSESSYGIDVFNLNGQSVSIIWDQIIVQTTTADDGRLNINTNAEIRVTLMRAYDGTFLGSSDSVTLDEVVMTWDSTNSWFDLVVSQSSVGAWLYYVNATSDATYGITSLDLNSSEVQVIWDQIIVQTTSADNIRVNVGDSAEIQVTLWFAYDHTMLGGSDSVTLDDILMTYDVGDSQFELSVSQSSVGLWVYYVNSTTDSTYGITVFDLNTQQVAVIWDRIVVQTTTVDDGRVDVNSNAEIRVTLILEYDGTYLGTSDSVTLNGIAMTWDDTNGWFELNVSHSSVGARTYFVNSSTATTYGIDLVNLNGHSISIIWDRVQVVSYSVTDDRVNVGDTVDVDVTLIYDYDDTPVTTGIVNINGKSATHQSAGVWRITDFETSVIMNTYDFVDSTGNVYGLTAVDQNSQTVNVIWDRLVITIDVDDASLLNGHQANFSLTVVFDYNDAICTTYHIEIDRNATLWHSFTNGNVTLFVDSGSDIAYLYNVSLVISEGTYGITVYTTNTLQVIWSLASNEVPVNDAMPLLTNGDDTDYLYARYRYYVITTSVSDADGYEDISYVELTLYSDDEITQYWTIRYDVDSNTFSVESGYPIVTIGSMSSAVGIGDTLIVTWHIKIGWDHTDIQNSDVLQFVTDGIASDSDFYESNWNIETRLDYLATPSLSDDHGSTGTSDLVGSGSVTYYGSSISPLSNETDVWILHDISGTWSGDLVSGSFSISGVGSSSIVRLNTYTFKIVVEGAGSGAVDLYHLTSVEDTFISDCIEVFEAGVVDGRIDINTAGEVWWRARYQYDETVIQNFLTITLNNSHTAIWDPINHYWYWQESWSIPHSEGYTVAFASETTYGISTWNVTTPVQQVIWDALVITLSAPTDQRINVNTNATGIIVTAMYAFDGTAFDGSFTLNNSIWSYATPQRQVYTVSSVSNDTYGITVILTNDVTYCIWDRVLVVSVSADEIFHDPNDDVQISVVLHYEFDGAQVTSGTFAIAGHSLSHIGSGEWLALITESDYTSIVFNDLTMCDALLYGISAYNMGSHSVTVYWDRIEFYSANVNDDRINVGTSIEISWNARLEHAGISITSGLTATMTDDVQLVLNAGAYSASVSKSDVGLFSFGVTSASLGEIDAFVQSVSDISIVWDRVKLTAITATALSQSIGVATEIHVTLVYEYDTTPVVDGVVLLDDNGDSIDMTYDSTNEYWKVSVVKNTGSDYSFTVASVSSNAYGITSLNLDGKSIEIQWIRTSGFAPNTMTLVAVGGGAGIAILGVAIVAMRRRGSAAATDAVDAASTPLAGDEFIEPSEPIEPSFDETEAETAALGSEAEETLEEVTPAEPEVDESLGVSPEEEIKSVGEVEIAPEEIEPKEIPSSTPELVEDTGEISSEVEEAPSPEDAIQEPSELEVEGISVEPEAEEISSPIEQEITDDEVSLDELSKDELLDRLPPEVRDAIPERDLEKMSQKDVKNLVESYTPSEEPPLDTKVDNVPSTPPEASLSGRSLTDLDKRELIKLLPEDIRDTISPGELRRLSKNELISLLESVLDVDEL